MAAHARDVNIFIWTSRKSVGHETNDRVMVHGDGTRADGRRSKIYARINKILGSQGGRGARSLRIKKSNVVDVQAGWLARPGTEAPETQFYFITHGSGTFPVPRVRSVVRGERASRSIVNRTTVFWSIWMAVPRVLAGLGSELLYAIARGCGFDVSRGSNGSSKIAQWALIRPKWTLPSTNGRKRT